MGKSRKKSFKNNSKSRQRNEYARENRKNFKIKQSKGKREREDKNFDFATGKLIMTTKGFAFVDIKQDEDVFIPASKVNGALNGDSVKIKFKKCSKGFEGSVVSIVKRGHQTLVGKVVQFSNNYYLEPNDSKYGNMLLVDGENSMIKEGDVVVASIIDYGVNNGMLKGEVIEKIDTEAKGGDILEIIREYELYEEFPPYIEKCARDVAKPITESDLAYREDFRNEIMFTIDGEDAKDFDDAVSLVRTEKGYKLGVHIADVSHYVKPGSPLDKEAFARGTSVYFPDRVLPMLPTALSNDMCSLNANVDRLTLSVIIEFDSETNVIDHKICESVINSNARMTYTDVYACLSGDKKARKKYAELSETFDLMEELSEKLILKREKRGALDFDFPECYIVVDEKGKTCDIRARERNSAHRLIESFMLIANEVVAEHYDRLGLPFVYRIHEKPTPEKMKALLEFVEAFNVKVNINPKDVKPDDLKSILKQIENEPYKNAVSEVLLRSLQKAKYAPKCLGHFGLAAPYYCHFTSPIRRYPDLSIHRIIKLHLHNKLEGVTLSNMAEFVIESSERSSEREKLAEQAEREVDAYKKAEYMQQFIGKHYEATISSVTQYGVYVSLENTVDGKIAIENLPDDYYKFSEKAYCLVGKKHKFTIGDKIDVTCIGTNLKEREVYFEYYDKENDVVIDGEEV